MHVSIIIPTFQEATEIADCITSARQAGATEVIVADGGSSDATVTIARDSADTVLSTQSGRAMQQNAAAAQATGDILLFLHADNRLAPDCLNQIATAVKEYGPMLFGGFRQQISADGWKFRWLERGNAERIRKLGWVYGDQAIFVQRDWFHAIGGFPDWPIMEDVELMRRLMQSARSIPDGTTGATDGVKKPLLLPGPVQVSARRWQRRGIASQTLRNWAMLLAWRCGVSPDTLARFYPLCPTRIPGDPAKLGTDVPERSRRKD